MRKIAYIVGLECYAIALAVVRFSTGLHTDEAKYLLNIPYPHPPFARFLLSLTKMLPYQELLWRIIFASLVIQSVWWVCSLTQDVRHRRILAALWLTVPAVIVQAGTIMMAPLTALSGFVFLVAAVSSQSIKAEKNVYLGKRQAFFLSLFWLVSLFTAYQAVLFLPLVIAALLRSSISRWKATVYIFAPLVVLTLYTLTNPLAIASMGNASTENGSLSALVHLQNAGMFWVLGGGIVFGLIGLIGIVLSRRIEVMATLILISAYCTLSYHDYYAIFLAPLFLFGTLIVAQRISKKFLIPLTILGVVSSLSISALILRSSMSAPVNISRQAMAQLRAAKPQFFDASASQRMMLIVGSFGHDWQYESPFNVRKYSDQLQDAHSDVLVCLQQCNEQVKQGMRRAAGVTAAEVYVR